MHISRTALGIVTLTAASVLFGESAIPLDLPLRFEPAPENTGKDVRFLAHTRSGSVDLSSYGFSMPLQHRRLTLQFAGAKRQAEAVGLEKLETRTNYFIGSNPARWRRDVPNYAKVRYTEIYPDIDLIYYGREGHLEYDLILAPHAQPNAIAMDFSGADQIRTDKKGDLLIQIGIREVRMEKPHVYQEIGGVRRRIDVLYSIRGTHRVRFQIPDYDPRYSMVIDPVLSYSTYLGGSGDEGGLAIAVDGAGNTYVAGSTASAAFPKMPGHPRSGNDTDAFVAKLNNSGTALVYVTYLGGTGNEIATGLAIDAAGNAYVAGGTGSRDFPTTSGAFQRSYAGAETQDLFWWWPGVSGDAFMAKLNPAGDALQYSTYLGGSGADLALRLRVDTSGNAYVTGNTTSLDFPTTKGAFQTVAPGGRGDTWVTKINASGSGLIYSTHVAASGDAGDIAFGLAVDGLGNAYVTGVSDDGFPVTAGAFQSQPRGRWDAFVAKLNPTGSGLVYATYLGSSGETYGFDIVVDAVGNAYVTGTSSAQDFPTTAGSFQKPIPQGAHGGKVFVTKLNASGSALLYSTWFGGSNADLGLAIALDTSANAYVAGRTRSRDFPQTGDTLQCRHGGGETDAFLLELNAKGSQMLHSTLLGGSGDETVGGLSLDITGNPILVGSTTSTNFPMTAAAYQTVFGGGPTKYYDTDALTPIGGDAYVVKIDFNTSPAIAIGCVANAASLDSQAVSPGEIISIWGAGMGPDGGVGGRLDSSGRLAQISPARRSSSMD
jgi:hypothetical protein